MAKPVFAIAAALALAGLAASVAAPVARAQSTLAAKLATDRLAAIHPGAYQAGDVASFTLSKDGAHYLLRFAGDPEVFVLYADHASLGGRVLKYDSGETALQITGWGGITLYTDKKPGGLPVERTGDADSAPLPDVSLEAVKSAASDEAKHLAYSRKLNLTFDGDWNNLADDAARRVWFFETLQNTARGLDRFSATPAGRRALGGHVTSVVVTTSDRPTLRLKGTTLTVTFDPGKGYAGRASSRAIAHALGTIFRVKTNGR